MQNVRTSVKPVQLKSLFLHMHTPEQSDDFIDEAMVSFPRGESGSLMWHLPHCPFWFQTVS